MSDYVKDPTTPSGWRFQHETPTPQFIAEKDSDGHPTGKLIPSVPRLADGRPVATTPEQVAALMELEAAEPLTLAEKLHQELVEQVFKAAERGLPDDELRKALDMQSRLDPRVEGSGIITRRAAPVTRAEQIDRMIAARNLAASLGYGFRTRIDYENVNGFDREILVCYVLNGGSGMVAYGPASLMDIEVCLAGEQGEKEAEKRKLAAMADYQQRKRDDMARRIANSPEGRIAALERKLSEATGQSAETGPASHEFMPGIVVGPMTVNDEPVENPLIPGTL